METRPSGNRRLIKHAYTTFDYNSNLEAAERFGTTRATVPLVISPHITCGNALRIDWNDVLLAEQCSYVMGNPPFIGKQFQNVEQKTDMELIAGKLKSYGLLDYVACWYIKATNYIYDSDANVAFVSTNSITQGEQVSILWGWLLSKGVSINFAHRTFRWDNEGKGVAAVHCVIIGFGRESKANKTIYDYGDDIEGEATVISVKSINPYLLNAPTILLENRKISICNAPAINYGSFALDDGNFTLTEDEKLIFIRNCKAQEEVILPFIGAREFLHNERRYAIWLANAASSKLAHMKDVLLRVEKVKEWRAKSDRKTTRELSGTPTIFAEIRQPNSPYIAIPTVCSEKRQYIPVAFLPPTTIASNQLYVIPNAHLYHFAILCSSMHNAWMRSVGGRLKSDYRYSASIIYNNFVFPINLDDKQTKELEHTAQLILDARANEQNASLAVLYNPLTMPVQLVKAHNANNDAVDKAYGYKGKNDDASRVAFLFKLYEQLTSILPAQSTKNVKVKKAEV